METMEHPTLSPVTKRIDLRLVLTIIAVYAVLFVLGIGCPIKFLTGISCAGCGMTRAWLSLLRGDVHAAFEYHPLFWEIVPVSVVFVFRDKINKSVFRAVLACFVVSFIALYIYRMIFLPNDIVVFKPQDGFIFRVVQYILK